jgi:hypothetical protein
MDIQDRRTTLEPRGALASCGPCADRRYGRLVGMPSTDHNSERFQQVRHRSSSCPWSTIIRREPIRGHAPDMALSDSVGESMLHVPLWRDSSREARAMRKSMMTCATLWDQW